MLEMGTSGSKNIRTDLTNERLSSSPPALPARDLPDIHLRKSTKCRWLGRRIECRWDKSCCGNNAGNRMAPRTSGQSSDNPCEDSPQTSDRRLLRYSA